MWLVQYKVISHFPAQDVFGSEMIHLAGTHTKIFLFSKDWFFPLLLSIYLGPLLKYMSTNSMHGSFIYVVYCILPGKITTAICLG